MKHFKLNPRQVWVHFIAFWLFIGSFRFLAYLSNIRVFKIFNKAKSSYNPFDHFQEENLKTREVYDYIELLFGSWFYAILIAFLISLIISWRRKWSWVNSVLVLISTFVLYRVPFYERPDMGWHTIIYYNPVPRTVGNYLAVGILLFVLGLILFLSPAINKYISLGVRTKNHISDVNKIVDAREP